MENKPEPKQTQAQAEAENPTDLQQAQAQVEPQAQTQEQFCSCCKPVDFFGFLNKRNSDMLGVDFTQTGFGPDYEPVCKISKSKTIFNKKN